jgi:hypothetical protein
MRALVTGLTWSLLLACQPLRWDGVWSGSATLNDGRRPTMATGTLTISPGAGIPAALLLSFDGGVVGEPKSFSCPPVLSSASSTATTLTLATPATCQLASNPPDGCTREVTFSSGELTLSSEQLSGSGNGRLSEACPGMGSSVADFGWTLTASDRR